MSQAEFPSSAVRGIEARQVFQWLSYAQYPALLVTAVYMVQSVIAMTAFRTAGWGPVLDLANLVLLYGGVAIGLSSLQDPSKTQNKISRRVWMDPAKGRVLLWILALEAFIPIALGLVAFGLGMIGLLKTAIEMREHHRLDRVPTGPQAAAGADL
jgi:hypothetical protein